MSAKLKPWGRLLLRVVCFPLLFAFLFHQATLVLRPNWTGGGCFYDEPADSLDVLFCGSSRMLNGVSPLRLYEWYGIPSHNLGQNGQVLPVTYYVLMDALTRQRPKVVVIDVYKVIHDTLYGTDAELHISLDDLPLGAAKLRAVRDLLPPERRAEYLVDLIAYHARWKELTVEDFRPPDGTEKGAQALFQQYALPEGWTATPEERTAPPVEVQLRYLEKIVQLCRDKGAQPLLLVLPSAAPADDGLDRQAIMNGIRAYAEDWNVPFVNLMYRLDELDFDLTRDLADAHHLNYRGMDKVTLWLGEYLRGRYDLPDHRGEAAYRDWDGATAGYDAYLAGRAG